jgi:hypothetical protein
MVGEPSAERPREGESRDHYGEGGRFGDESPQTFRGQHRESIADSETAAASVARKGACG